MSSIEGIISSEWGISNPAKASVKFSVDEYVPIDPSFQILTENIGTKSEFLIDNIYKIIQTIKLTVFLKPTHYTPSVITAAKTTFYNAIAEIDRIIREARNASSDQQIDLIGWIEVKIPKGVGLQPEPLTLSLSQNITVEYYQ